MANHSSTITTATSTLACQIIKAIARKRRQGRKNVILIVSNGLAPSPAVNIRTMSLEMAVSFAKQFSPKAIEESPLLSFLVTTLSNLRRLCSLYVLQEIQDAEKKTTFGLPMPFVDLAFRKLATNVAKSAAEGGPLMEDFFRRAARLWKAASVHSKLRKNVEDFCRDSTNSRYLQVRPSLIDCPGLWPGATMLELLVRGNSDLVVTLDSLEYAREVDVTLVLNLPFGSDLHRHSVLGTLECAWSDCPLNIGKCAVVNCETVAEIPKPFNGGNDFDLAMFPRAGGTADVWVVRLWVGDPERAIIPFTEYANAVLAPRHIPAGIDSILVETFIPADGDAFDNAERGHFAYYWVPASWQGALPPGDYVPNCRVVDAVEKSPLDLRRCAGDVGFERDSAESSSTGESSESSQSLTPHPGRDVIATLTNTSVRRVGSDGINLQLWIAGCEPPTTAGYIDIMDADDITESRSIYGDNDDAQMIFALRVSNVRDDTISRALLYGGDSEMKGIERFLSGRSRFAAKRRAALREFYARSVSQDASAPVQPFRADSQMIQALRAIPVSDSDISRALLYSGKNGRRDIDRFLSGCCHEIDRRRESLDAFCAKHGIVRGGF